MNKNTAKIRAGIRALILRPYEIISGTVVSGSADITACTITVQPSDDGEPITNVRLSAITGDNNGALLFPADNSNVVIASIDGPGEWMLVKASELTKAVIKIGAVTCELGGDEVSIRNNDVVFNISSSVFKINTSAESLFTLLKDLITCITMLTVPTPAGTSSVPVNSTSFNDLLTRLSNLLTN